MTAATIARPLGPTAARRRQLAFCGPAALLEEGGTPTHARSAILFGMIMLAATVIWAATARLEEVAHVQGQVIPAGSVRVVQHLEGGIVAGILVSEGDVVEAGQVMLRLDPVASTADQGAAAARATALALRAERLRALMEGRAPEFDVIAPGQPELAEAEMNLLAAALHDYDSQRKVLDAEIAERRAEIGALAGRRAAAEEQLALITEELAMRQQLYEEKLLSKVVYLETKREHARAEADLAETIAGIGQLNEAIATAEGRRAELDARLGHDAATELGEVESELAEVRATLGRLTDRVRRLDVVAPVRGIVKGLRVTTAGGVVAPGADLLDLVPIDETLMVEARLAPRDAGAVQPGQATRVSVSAFDTTEYGYASGTVEDVSATTFIDEGGVPYYKARIALAAGYVGTDPERGRLLPGMTVQADIGTGDKTLLAYLLKPIYLALDRAFAER